MKLATWKDGSRDGQLVVVSRDLATAHFAHGRVTTLQQALDDWNFLSPQLQELSLSLDEGKARHAFAFEPQRCAAPLPRAYQWACAVGAGDTALQLLPADDLLGPRDRVRVEPGSRSNVAPVLAAVTGDLERGAGTQTALEAVRLLTLCGVWHVAVPAGSAGSSPPPIDLALATSFAPVMVTPDELGPAWRDGRLQGDLQVERGAAPARRANAQAHAPADAHAHADAHANGTATAAADPAPSLGEALTRLCQSRRVRAGALVGTRCGGMVALALDATPCVSWRLPDGTDPFGAIELGAQAIEKTPQRSRFG